uniref:Ig-like domain-containing protein n=1 Tax=Macrostomum lignano TaxID=282301 RepID=A0A1I8H395_9PLAT
MPATERCKASCNDEQCSEVNAKCLALTRSGDCPPLKISGDACERQCDFDLDCPDERQKCCQSGCAQGRSCQNPYLTPPPPTTNRPPQVPCDKTPHGCCPDGETTADNPSLTNCPAVRSQKQVSQQPMQSIVVLEGVRLKLDCGFLAVPKPTVMWLKDNRPVVQDQRVRIDGQKLKLRQVTESDSGEYECSAYNSEGQAARKISLAVQVPATILSLEAPEQPLLVRGEQIQLICNATGKPKPEIRWLKYDQTIPGEIADTLNLTVGPAAVAEYTCRAENEAGPPVQAKTSIEFREPLRAAVEVISPAGKTEEGGRIRLQSQLKAGYPAPFLYLWFKEVQQSESSTNGSVATAAPLGTGMSLDLDPLKLSHSGRYFLRVTNQFETVESERVTVTVMSQCGDVLCDTRCRYGYQRDNKTCSTCQCINPCQDNTCNKGQVCRPFCLDINDCTKFQTECISAPRRWWDEWPPCCQNRFWWRAIRMATEKPCRISSDASPNRCSPMTRSVGSRQISLMRNLGLCSVMEKYIGRKSDCLASACPPNSRSARRRRSRDGHRRQQGASGHVADSVDAGHVGVLKLVHPDVAGRVQCDAGAVGGSQPVGTGRPAHRPDQRADAFDGGAAAQANLQLALTRRVAEASAVTEATFSFHRNLTPFCIISSRICVREKMWNCGLSFRRTQHPDPHRVLNQAVKVAQDARRPADDVHLGAEGVEDAGQLDADVANADNHCAARQRLQLEEAIASNIDTRATQAGLLNQSHLGAILGSTACTGNATRSSTDHKVP